ncbi:MAG: ABC transporter substrate-binding protein [Candidatus Bathyarchaeia archaeon]
MVVENHWGTYIDPYDFNFKIPGKPATGGNGFQQLCAAFLWYVNTTTGTLINWLGTGFEYSADFKTVRFFLRKGATWNDGKPFTAHDVVFTIETALKTKEWATHTFAVTWIESARAVDDYTVEIKLKAPYPRFHYAFTVIIYGTGWWIVPKHIWEGKDPVTFKFYPPLSIGPYNLKAVDPAGNWFLWEREENWWATKLLGLKPSPKYVLYIHPGPDEVKALAMVRHELDCLRTLVPEAAEIVIKGNPYIMGWRRIAPFAWPLDACVKGIGFNLLMYPYNITEVRKALVFAINFRDVYEAFRGVDGSLPSTTPLPIVPYPFAIEAYTKPLLPELIKLGLDPNTGWWKYDPAEAERLLKSVGFTRVPDGKWRLPTGEPWKIGITAPSGFEMESLRIAFLVADHWKKFGIDVEVEPVEAGIFSARGAKGDPGGAGTRWPGCTLLLELTPHIQGWHSKYYNPLAPGLGWANYSFPRRAELNAIIDEMERTPPWEEEKVIELGRKALLIWAEQMPWIGFFPTPFYTLQDGYAWDGWPTYPENYYMDPVSWWAQHMFVILRLYPTGRAPTKDALPRPGWTPVEYSSVWIVGDVPAFTGVDGLSYGPYSMGDYVRIPKEDAERLIAQGLASHVPPAYVYVTVYAKTNIPAFTGTDGKTYGPFKAGDALVIPREDAEKLVAEGKVTYSPPVPAEIPEIAKAVSDLIGKVSALEATTSAIRTELTSATSDLKSSASTMSASVSDLKDSISALRGDISALGSQLSTIATISYALIALVILTLVVTVILLLRKPAS